MNSWKNTAVCKDSEYHCTLQCSETGKSNAGKADRTDECWWNYYLRLVGEENSVVGHCLQFCNVFIKQLLSLGSEAIFNLRPNKRTFAFY